MSFFTRLTARARAVDSLLCVGLDPHPDLLGGGGAATARAFWLRLIEATAAGGGGRPPPPDRRGGGGAATARAFCLRLIEATAAEACAFKPNSAFFEAFGSEGIEALAGVIAAVPDGIPVILDVKRGDIPSTAEAHARAAFERLGADAVTLNPYLGRASLD